MKIKLTFCQWLNIINPNCKITITTEDGHIYQSQKKDGLNFEMSWIGFDFNSLNKQD